jgi:hypothetical protein
MIAIFVAAALTGTAPAWCADPTAPGAPRNVEDTTACAAWGVPFYMDRMMSYRDGPQTCDGAAKHLMQNGNPGRDPPQVGDGYWVESWDMSKPSIRCHIVRIDGKTIEMR